MSEKNLASTAGDVSYIAFAGETDGLYSLLEMKVEPGGGPPPHTHTYEAEGFLVLEGEFRFWLGDNPPKDAGKGKHVYGRRGTPHYFKNVGETPGRILLIFIPGGCERYFVELGEARATNGPDLPEQIKTIDKKFGMIIDRP